MPFGEIRMLEVSEDYPGGDIQQIIGAQERSQFGKQFFAMYLPTKKQLEKGICGQESSKGSAPQNINFKRQQGKATFKKMTKEWL